MKIKRGQLIIALAILIVGLVLSFFTAYTYMGGLLTGIGGMLLTLVLVGSYVVHKHIEYVD